MNPKIVKILVDCGATEIMVYGVYVNYSPKDIIAICESLPEHWEYSVENP